jgi:primosomal protein N' (replication factor Y)
LNFKCNQCNSSQLTLFGAGTQKVEKHLSKLFPKAKLLRMDSDVMKTENDHIELINKYEKGEADILIGTQMVAKGLDFKNVTLVGIINADISLSSPDFRTGEKIFQLLYQVCGRSGRHKKNGCAIIQTEKPNNQYIKLASSLDINKFYNIELSNRLELNYPPSTKIVKIIIKGKNLKNVIFEAEKLKKKLLKKCINVLGPIPAPLEKIKLFWRYIIVIKGDKKNSIHTSIIKSININNLEKFNNKVKIQLDVDPTSLL